MRFLFLTFLFLLTQNAQAQTTTPVDAQWVNEIIHEYFEREDIPSLTFALVDSNGIRLSAKKGPSQRETGRPVDANSAYQIGSLSKLFTGIIIRNLIQSGKLDPQKSFVHYLEGDLPAATREKWASVKLIDLLHHRAGLPNHGPATPPTPNGIAMRGDYSSAQLLADLKQIPFRQDHRERVSYSNYGYGLLGYIAETVSGKSYSELLTFYVSEPYQLPQTTTRPPAADQLVTPYFIGKRDKATQYWQMGAETPAGGIFSTLNDLAKLQTQQLRVYQQEQCRDPLWLSDQLNPFDAIGYMQYGYGLMKNRSVFDSTFVKYEHGGDLDGFASQYKFFPQLGLGYVLLTASGGPWFNELDALIEQKLIGAPIREAISLEKKQLKIFEGIYRFDSGFEFEIAREQEQLKVYFPGNDPVNLYPAAQDLLFFRHMNVQLKFKLDQKGKVAEVIYVQNGEPFYPEKIK